MLRRRSLMPPFALRQADAINFHHGSSHRMMFALSHRYAIATTTPSAITVADHFAILMRLRFYFAPLSAIFFDTHDYFTYYAIYATISSFARCR